MLKQVKSQCVPASYGPQKPLPDSASTQTTRHALQCGWTVPDPVWNQRHFLQWDGGKTLWNIPPPPIWEICTAVLRQRYRPIAVWGLRLRYSRICLWMMFKLGRLSKWTVPEMKVQKKSHSQSRLDLAALHQLSVTQKVRAFRQNYISTRLCNVDMLLLFAFLLLPQKVLIAGYKRIHTPFLLHFVL